MSDVDNDMYKNYQKSVKGYLSLETPFRGLLVYHGLGTGKTATSIITTEGLSQRRINTFLPKSLKENSYANLFEAPKDFVVKNTIIKNRKIFLYLPNIMQSITFFA